MLLRKKFIGADGISTPIGPVDGAYGIFRVGSYSSTATTKYTFASDTAVVGATTPTGGYGDASGNGSMGILYPIVSNSPLVKYTWASNTTSTLAASIGIDSGSGSAAAGNSTVGVYESNGPSAATRVFTYAAGTLTTTTFSGAQMTSGAGVGTADYAIFALGGGGKVTYKYTYADGTVGTATQILVNGTGMSAAGNATFGIFAVGGPSASVTTNKYTYASAVVTAATNLTAVTKSYNAAGNSLYGLFVTGSGSSNSTGTSKYTYSGDTTVTGSLLTAPQDASTPAATSNGVIGVTS